ncbi:MAG: hypothetical protein RL885_20260 [Planctomycetota bacterium]
MFRLTHVLAAASFILVALTPASAQDEDAREMKLIDLTTLTQSVRPIPYRSTATPLRAPGATYDYDESAKSPLATSYQFHEEYPAFLEADQIVEMVQNLVHPETWDQENTWISLFSQGQVLAMQNRPDVLEQATKLIDHLRALAARRVEVRVDVFNMSPKVAGGLLGRFGRVLDQSQRKELLAQSGVSLIGSSLQTLRPGQLGRLLDQDLISFIADFDVEVAQEESISDPLIGVLQAGLEVAVRASDRHDSGGLQIELTIDDVVAEGDWKSRQTSDGAGTVQLPVVSLNRSLASAKVSEGESMLLWSSGSMGLSRGYLIQARVIGEPLKNLLQPMPLGHSELATIVVPVHTLISKVLMPNGPVRAFEEPLRTSYQDFEMDISDHETVHRIEEDMLHETIYGQVDLETWESIEGTQISIFNGYLIARNGQSSLAKIGTLLSRLEAELLPQDYVLEAEVWSVPLSDDSIRSLGVLSGDAAKALREKGRLVHSSRLCAIAGNLAESMVGSERAYVWDFNPEIAQGASISDPVMSSTFSGGMVRAQVGAPAGGPLSLDATLSLSSLTAQDSVSPSAPRIGELDLPRVRVHSVSGQASLKAGQSVVLGERSDSGQRLVFVVTVRD